jgi:hypothetical protein
VFDFNQDQVQDLIAVDALNNSLNFFENTEIGGFFSTRSIQYDETLYSLVISDLNDDLFKDLLISKEKGIEILLGDSVFSYQQNIKFSYNYTPGKCYTTDVNLNSKTDLITLNLSDNYFNILFDFLESDYSIDYSLDRVTDVKNSSSVSDKRLYLLSREGKFQIIGRKSLWGKNFNLSIGGSPDLLKPARIENEKDFYFVAADTRESRINILKFNNNGINQTIYRIGLLNSFIEFTFSSDLDVLAAFSPRSRFIEIIEKEHSDNNFRSSAYLYAKYPIENILIDQSKKFKVLEVSRTRLFLETLYKEDESYLSENVLHLDSSAISSLIAGNGNIFYWTDKNDSILNLKSYYSGNEKVIYSADIADTIKFRPVLLSNGSEGNNEIISVFHNGEKETILLLNDARVVELNSDYGLLSENMNFQNGLNYYSDVLGKKTVLQHLPDDEKLKFFIIDQGSKKLIRSRIVNEFNAYDYFIGKYFNNYYLIYSNKDNNSISFKVLDK